jgi:hypothetical protein
LKPYNSLRGQRRKDMPNEKKKSGNRVQIPGQKERLKGVTSPRELPPLKPPRNPKPPQEPPHELPYPPGLVTQSITTSLYEYVKRMLELGVVTGKLGEMMMHPSLEELKNALHTVMAGGTVEITFIEGEEGNGVVKKELNELFEYAYYEANEINKKARYRLTLEL